MDYFGEPFDILGTLGPPTRFQPQWTGKGFQHFVFDSSPVGHIISPDLSHHQVINVHPENRDLPVERELLGYIKETGYNPAEFRLPEHQTGWDQLSEVFGFPDTRPSTGGIRLPHDETAASSGDINPMTGRWPSEHPRGRQG